MTPYAAPVRDFRFVLEELLEHGSLALPGFEEASPDLVEAVLEEAAKLAGDVWAPLNASGDRQGCTRRQDGSVSVPDGFIEAYQAYAEGGWNGIGVSEARGGQGLPEVVASAVQEMLHGANMALGLCPMLTAGAIEALAHHGSEEQQATYLPKLVEGTWTGTMNLTEPQAGSDLSKVRTRAVPCPEGEGDYYRLSGQKIYITWGEHDAAENILHLVLARTPDAPEGNRGISLFLVPKFLVNDDGSLGERNDVTCASIEHKLGIHGSPTCTLSFGENAGAIGYLVGEPVAARKRAQEVEVVEHGPRRGEGADEVLATLEIDGVLDPDAAVVLRQHRGWQADQPHAPVTQGRSQAERVQNCATADDDDIGVTVHAVTLDVVQHALDRCQVDLDGLSAGHRDRCTQ